MADALDSFAHVTFDDRSKKGAVAKKIKESLGGRDTADTWNANQVQG